MFRCLLVAAAADAAAAAAARCGDGDEGANRDDTAARRITRQSISDVSPLAVFTDAYS